MDRYRNVFEEALARIQQQQGPPPGAFSPAAFGYPVPQPQTSPFDTWEQNGVGGWGNAPSGLFGLPGPSSPTWSLGDVSGWGSWPGSTPGGTSPPYSMSTRPDGMTLFGETPLTLHRRGETGGGASAVAAPSPSPTQVAGVGTRESVMRWLPQVQQVAAKYGVPAELVLAVMHNESGGDPKAQSGYNPGQGYARGLMQVMPFHFQDGEDPFDPMTNLDKGVKFLGAMYKQYGRDPQKAMAAYFGGPSAIDANGNIRTDRRDINISIGDYLTKKFTPTFAAYQQALNGGTPVAPVAPVSRAGQQGGPWGHVVPGGQGRVESGGTHGGHPAIDIFAPSGTPILAPTDGASAPATYPLGGNATTLQGADGRWYYFAHALAPMRGGQVRKGDVIGYVGNTGNAKNTASHLHYAVATTPRAFDMYNGSGDLDPN